VTPEPTRQPTRPADPLSILCLATGISSLLFAVVSVLPLVGMCTLPFSVLSVLTSVISGIASLIRTSLKPELEGRLQALAGLGLSVVWCLAAVLIAMFLSRTN
jgi:hypothetical protein